MNFSRFASALARLPILFVAVLCPYVAGADESLQSYDIEAQPMDRALKAFAAQTEIQVAFAPETVEGLVAQAVEGDFVPESALQALIDESGLDYEFASDRLVVVHAPHTNDQGGDSDSGNVRPQPVLMAQNQTSQAQTTSNSRSSEGGTSIVTGKVTDARTGANLKGALVTIEETGQSTSTNDLGEFRFVNVPTGSATLTVSYLGYAGQSAVVSVRGAAIAQDFVLRGGNEIEEIVVFGQRSARALALNQERTAANSSTVISSDLLGQFDGTTIRYGVKEK